MMMKKILSLLVATTLLVSCASEEAAAPSNVLRVNVEVDGVPSTKGFIGNSTVAASATAHAVTGISSAAGGLGIFLVGTGYTSEPLSWTFNTSWAASKSVYLSGNEATLYAYYPPTLSPSTTTRLANLDKTASGAANSAAILVAGQKLKNDNMQSDFLYLTSAVKVSNVSTSTATATLSLSHAMAKLNFVINLDDNYPVGTAPACTSVSLSSVSTKLLASIGTTQSTYNVSDGSFASLNQVSSISFVDDGSTVANTKANRGNNTFSVLVAPIAAASDIKLNMTIDGKAYSATLTSIAWEKGKQMTFTVTVSPTAMTVANTVSVTDWTTGGTGTATYQ